MHCSMFVQENATRQERLEKEMAELKENTLAEEEVVKLVELKCIKLRQYFLFKFNATDTNNYPRP